MDSLLTYYAQIVKGELSRELPKKKCCQLAEAYGVLLYCSRFSNDGLRIVTESEPFAKQLPRLFRKAFDVAFDRMPEETHGRRMVFAIENRETMNRIMDRCGYSLESSVSMHLNYALLEENCCRLAFLRGAFLAGGSVSDPEKSYHLELVTNHYSVSRELTGLMEECAFTPKSVVRKANYVTYFKQSESIADFLTAIGAPIAAMEVMNAKVGKTIVNKANRRSNCDMANLDKMVSAAQGQLAAIRQIEEGVGLESLPEKLQEAAVLRRDHPELSLSQLAELCDPPVTKSSFNHRLQRVMELGAKAAK